MEIAVDEAAGRQRFLIQGMFDTVADIVAMANDAAAIGVDAMLLGHPNSFYPADAAAVEAYTEEVCAGTDLAVILFIVEHSNLRRLDVRGFPSEALVRMAGLETVVAVKYEVGREQPTNTWEAFTRLQKTGVLLSDPMEFHAPLWVERFGMQWIGTSNYEYYGDAVPRIMEMLCSGEPKRPWIFIGRSNRRAGHGRRPPGRGPTWCTAISGSSRPGSTATTAVRFVSR